LGIKEMQPIARRVFYELFSTLNARLGVKFRACKREWPFAPSQKLFCGKLLQASNEYLRQG
jgi:hypothetical protein